MDGLPGLHAAQSAGLCSLMGPTFRGPLQFTDDCSLASHVLQKVSQTGCIFKSLHKPWWPEKELHIDFSQIDHLQVPVELDCMNGVAWALRAHWENSEGREAQGLPL